MKIVYTENKIKENTGTKKEKILKSEKTYTAEEVRNMIAAILEEKGETNE